MIELLRCEEKYSFGKVGGRAWAYKQDSCEILDPCALAPCIDSLSVGKTNTGNQRRAVFLDVMDEWSFTLLGVPCHGDTAS
jgi:hypothetical protein